MASIIRRSPIYGLIKQTFDPTPTAIRYSLLFGHHAKQKGYVDLEINFEKFYGSYQRVELSLQIESF